MSGRNGGVAEPICDSDVCSMMDVLDRISGKWAVGILLQTIRGPMRFTELERAVRGISRRMLTLNLRSLERDGLIVRTVYPTVPPKVEYAATDMARELYGSLAGLTSWAVRHRDAIVAAREAYDRRSSEPAPEPTRHGHTDVPS